MSSVTAFRLTVYVSQLVGFAGVIPVAIATEEFKIPERITYGSFGQTAVDRIRKAGLARALEIVQRGYPLMDGASIRVIAPHRIHEVKIDEVTVDPGETE